MVGQPPLTVVSWGGALTKSQMIAIVDPYREATGRWANVEDYAGGLEQIRDQVLSQNVKWDVVSLDLPDAMQGCDEGLLEPIDASILPEAPDGTPPTEDFLEVALQECAIGPNIWATVIAYDPAQLTSGAPSGLADFFDLDRFSGRRGLPMGPRVNLQWALQVYDVLSTEVDRNS